MRRPLLANLLLLPLLAVPALAAPAPVNPPRAASILVLDDCDDKYDGKAEFRDNLTRLDSAGKQAFRISGFNNCESIGSSRMVATDPARKGIWVIENVAHRVRRFDPAGKETLAIPNVNGSAVAVDPETGNVWVLAGQGHIGRGHTEVYDAKGRKVASHAITGWDIAYDRKAKAFWIADRKLTKVDAATGKVAFSLEITSWCASSLDVDPRTGMAWVAVREHPDVPGSRNRLLKFDASGKKVADIALGDKTPFRVSVDAKDGSVWVALMLKSVAHYSAEGKPRGEHALQALTVQADPVGGGAWVVTPEEVLLLTRKGDVARRARHAGKTSQAWISALE